MKKGLVFILIVLLAMFSVSASGSSESGSRELVVYSAASEGEAESITKAFNELYPDINVTIIRAGSGDLVTRVKTEWPKPDGDVILLMGSENLDQIYDMLMPYTSANHDKIDEENRDQKSDEPRYYGTSMPLQAIMYNTDLLTAEEAPASWADLADPKYQGEIVLANPASSGSAYAQLYMMNKLYGMDFVADVVKNTTFVASSTAGPDSVARGEYAITVTGEFNIANKIQAGDPVAYVLPEEGTGRRIEGSAILANCKHPEEAKLFIDFMTSTEAFQIVRDECNRRPVSTEIPGPEGLPALSEMKFFIYDTDEAASIKRDLVQQFNGLL